MKELTTQPENAKVVRSKWKLRQALLRLITHRSVGSINVSELCAEAQVNRTTFYKYYKSIDELLDAVENYILDEWRHIIANHPLDKDPARTVELCLSLICKNQDMSNVTFVAGRYSFALRIFELFHDHLIEVWRKQLGDKPVDAGKMEIAYYYVLYGAFGVIKNWYSKGLQVDIKKLGQMILSITAFDVNLLLETEQPAK